MVTDTPTRLGLWGYTEPDIPGYRKDPLYSSTLDLEPPTLGVRPDALSSGRDIHPPFPGRFAVRKNSCQAPLDFGESNATVAAIATLETTRYHKR